MYQAKVAKLFKVKGHNKGVTPIYPVTSLKSKCVRIMHNAGYEPEFSWSSMHTTTHKVPFVYVNMYLIKGCAKMWMQNRWRKG